MANKKVSKDELLVNIIKGIEEVKGNDIDILDVLEFCKKENFSVRYIEFMENSFAKNGAKGLNSDEILEIISKKVKQKILLV